MAAVRIHRPPICSDSAAEVPREQWPMLVEERQRSCHAFMHSDCRLLLFFVKDGAENSWLGYPDRETYLREGLHLEPDLVAWAMEGLRKADPATAVTFDQAVVLGKHGTNQHTRGGNNITSSRERGTAVSYTLARLRRDRPELAERVELPKKNPHHISANAAAIEAGFRERTITVPLDPDKAAPILRRHFTGRALARLREIL